MGIKLKSDCFSILNTNGEQVLFRTLDTSINKLTFSIINKTGAALSLTGDPGGTKSSFNFNFEVMLTHEVVENLTITLPENWGKTFFVESGIPAWSVYPTADMVIEPDEVVQILLTNISSQDTAPGNFYIGYLNVPGYDDPNFPFAKHLAVINPPDPAKKTLPLQGAYTNVIHPIQGQYVLVEEGAEVFDDGQALPVYITYDPLALIENGFTYRLANTSKDPLASSAAQQDGNSAAPPPTMYISFLFGEQDSDITTQPLADNNISIDVDAVLPWKPVKHTGGTSYWQFLPESQQIINGHGVVSFPIHKIITALNVKPDTISIMYIQINDIPGYNDMTRTILLQKLAAKAKMESLEASKYFIYADENISISWESSLAKRVTIEYNLKGGGRVFLDSAKGEIKLNGRDFWLPVQPSAEDTIITAIAYDNTGQSSIQKTIKVSYDWPQAEILSFTAGAGLLAARQQSASYIDYYLNWKITFTKKIVIRWTWGDPVEFPPTVTSTVLRVYVVHYWADFTLEAYSLNPKYTEPTRRKIQLRNVL